MKNTWNILFVLFLLIETACNSPSQSIKNTDLVAEDSICFPIDEHTYYASKSIFQFEENGHEYLSFLDANISTNNSKTPFLNCVSIHPPQKNNNTTTMYCQVVFIT